MPRAYHPDSGINPEDSLVHIPIPGPIDFRQGRWGTEPGAGSGGGGGGSVPPPGGGRTPPPTPPGGTAPTPTPAGGGTPVPAAAGAGSFLDWLQDPGNIAGLGALIAALTGGRGDSANPQDTEELRRIQAITEQRMRRVDPLHQAVSALAFSRMPTSSRQGITFTNSPLPPQG